MVIAKAAIYIRVSTNEQIEFSPEAQKTALLEYARKNKISISEKHIYTDEGYSGRQAEKRPAFMNMIKAAKIKPKEFDLILVHKYDRFARNREDSVVYKSLLRKEYGIKVISITEQFEDDKFSIILESMLEAMAEYYSLNLADEVKKGMKEKARRGEFQGSPPLGYEITNKGDIPTIISQEAWVVRLIYKKFDIENMSCYEIARYLNDSGYRTKKNNLFETRGIRYILQNPFYCGEVRWNYRMKNQINKENEWIIEKGNHDILIAKDDWYRIQAKLESKTKESPINSMVKRHWLSGLLKCSYCNGTMTYVKIKGKYKYYRCNKHLKGSCTKANYIKVDELEELILKQIFNDMRQYAVKIQHQKTENREYKNLVKQKNTLLKKEKNAKEAYLSGVDTLTEYSVNKDIIREEQKKVEEAIEKLNLNNIIDYAKNNEIMIKDILVDQDINMILKNKVIRSIIRYIEVNKYEKDIKLYYYTS